MPSGTTVAVTSKDYTENSLACEAEIISGDLTVPANNNLLTPTAFSSASNREVYYKVRLGKCALGDVVRVTVTVPGAVAMSQDFDITN
mgnify:FL=1